MSIETNVLRERSAWEFSHSLDPKRTSVPIDPHQRLVQLRSLFLSRETHMARLFLSITALLAGLSDAAFGQTSTEIAPGGKLRVGMIAITVLGGVAEPVAKFVRTEAGCGG